MVPGEFSKECINGCGRVLFFNVLAIFGGSPSTLPVGDDILGELQPSLSKVSSSLINQIELDPSTFLIEFIRD